MAKRIAVFTGTRAEYGLLYWLMKDIERDPDVELKVIVSGMHLSPEFGETWTQIRDDGFEIDAKVEILLSSDTPVGVVKSMGLGLISFAEALDRLKPDLLVVLGDRFEAVAVTQAALVMRIPVAHLHGGELTEGAYDDAFRHAITKMSSLHFTAADSYRQRVIQMGEAPGSVFNVGAVGLDHLVRNTLQDSGEVAESLGFHLKGPYFMVAYHPVTLGRENPAQTFRELLDALDRFGDHQVIITYPNADNGGRSIIALIEEYSSKAPSRVHAVRSLGSNRYLSLLKGSSALIGNSSSGIIEAPSAGVPTVNVGVRQLGRLAAESVVHADANADAIAEAIARVIQPEFAQMSRSVANPYGKGDASGQILAVLKEYRGTSLKHFHNLNQ